MASRRWPMMAKLLISSRAGRPGQRQSRALHSRIEPRVAPLESRLAPTAAPWSVVGPYSAEQWSLIQHTAADSWTAEANSAITIAEAADVAGRMLPLRLDEANLAQRLDQGLSEIALPRPDGLFERFRMWRIETLDPKLAAEYPGITTYRGQGIDDPAAILAADLTYQGFHAQVFRSGTSFQIQPVTVVSTGDYYSYFDADLANPHGGGCHCPACVAATNSSGGMTGDNNGGITASSNFTNGANLRTLRLAVGSTGEYTAAAGGTVPLALSAITTVVNNVNAIFERDAAVRMTLVGSQASVIYTNAATDPYTGNNAAIMMSENQTTLDGVIGTSAYDIGHVFGGNNLGGIATVGVVGSAGLKARGVSTTNGGSPTNAWMTFVVAHEMGHQFNALHTFNGISSTLDPNRSSSAAYEPGSGSTILSYGGLGGNGQDFVGLGDTYFHAMSLDAITSFVAGLPGTVGTKTATGNTIPTINAGANVTIPANTSFALTAVVNDPDGDTLTITWEQFDLGAAQSLGSADNGSSPLFRSLPPSSSPTRFFPNLTNLLNNTSSATEVMPSTNRSLNFRAAVRDNKAGNGAVATDDIKLTVVKTATQFKVTSPNTAISWPGLSTQTVTWDVGETNLAPINASQVNILLSTDGGLTFPTTLVTNTANDGSELVVLPNVATSNARIKVQPVGNVFFDVSNVNFTITVASTMQVASITPAKSSTVTTPFTSVDVAYTNNVKVSTVDTSDLVLSRGNVTATQILDAKTVRYTLSGISLEAPLNMTIPASAVTDNSNNGVGQYISDYTVDVGTEAFPALAAAAPVGSLIYTGAAAAGIGTASDADSFTLNLDAGQLLTILSTPAAGLQPQVNLTGPGGVNVTVGASGAGQTALIASTPISTTGVYTIKASGLASTTGAYTLNVTTNAAAELETTGGGGNNLPAGAQALTFLNVGGLTDRAGAIGQADASGEQEPNNSTATATASINSYGSPVVVSGFQRYMMSTKGSISSGADVDYLNLGSLPASSFLSVTVSGADSLRGTLVNPEFTIYRNNGGSPVVFSAQTSNNGPGNDEIHDNATVLIADTYFLAISGAGTTGSYEANITLRTATAPSSAGSVYNEAEPNNTTGTATNISTSWRVHQYESSTDATLAIGDVDFYSLSFAANDFVTILVQSLSALDAKLTLRDAAGTAIALDDGTSSTLISGDSVLYSYRIPTTGTYFAEVGAAGQSGAYALLIDVAGAAPGPTPAPPDHYSLVLTAGQSINVIAEGNAVSVLDLTLVDASSVVLASSTGTPTNVDKNLSYTAAANGTYYIRVTPAQNSSYQLVATRDGSFDSENNDSFALAQALSAERAVGAVVAANADWYQFPMTAGEIIVLSTTTPGDGAGEFTNVFDPIVDLYDPSGALVASDDNSAADGRNAYLARQAGQTGNYRVQVRSAGGKSGEYVLRRLILPNQTPLLVAPPALTPPEAQLFNYTATVSNPTPDLAVTFSLVNPPAGMTIHPTSGLISWTPADNQILSNCKIRAEYTSIPTLFDEEPLPVAVQNVAPTATSVTGPATGNLGQSLAFTVNGGTDVSSVDVAAGLLYSFDFDNDGNFEIIQAASPTGNHTYNKGGNHTVVGRVEDKDGGFKDYTTTVAITAPPRVTDVKINGGDPQRSRVTALSVTFDRIVTFAGPTENAFLVMRQSDSTFATVAVTNVDTTGPGTIVTLGFTGTTTVDSGSLADGRYTLIVLADNVTYLGGKLDGNGDLVPGDNYVLACEPDTMLPPTNIFRLFGDASGDGAVSNIDFNLFRNSFGGTDNLFDFDNDGSVGNNDFNQFKTRFGASI